MGWGREGWDVHGCSSGGCCATFGTDGWGGHSCHFRADVDNTGPLLPLTVPDQVAGLYFPLPCIHKQ